jgi:hypothetical protein
MEDAVNNTITVADCPFSLPEPHASLLLAPTSPVRESWLTLVKELADPSRLEELWVKFTVVHKIVSMFGDEDWNERNLGYFALQHRLWWVAQVQPWFSISQVRTCQEYIQTSMSALVLELWWRFVWAVHTENVFNAKAPKEPAKDIEAEMDNGMDASGEDILDASELGEGSESESESVGESPLDDSMADDIDLQHGDMGKLKSFFVQNMMQEDAAESDSDSSEDECHRRASPTSTNTTATGQIISEGYILHESLNGQDEGHWLTQIPSSTPLFFEQARINDVIETIEKQYWAHGKWECKPAFDLLLEMIIDRNIDLQLPAIPKSTIIAHMDYAYNKVFVPFLDEIGIITVKDETNDDSDMSSLDSSVSLNLRSLWSFNPSYGSYWVDTVMMCMFGNLTNEGMAPSVHFIGLFPQLLLNADSKADAQLSRVYEDLHEKLVSRGTITPQLEGLIATLDSLEVERNALLRQDRIQLKGTRVSKAVGSTRSMEISGSKSEDGDEGDPDAIPQSWNPTPMESRLHEHRMLRVRQIDSMIAEIKTEFNQMTGSIDRLQSRRRKKKSKAEEASDLSNLVDEPSASTSLPSDAELWGDMPSIDPVPNQ